MPFIQEDQPIQTLSTDCTDQSLAERVRLRAPHRRFQHRQAVPAEKAVLVVAVDVVAAYGYASCEMISVLLSLLLTLRTWVRSRAALQIEVLALRHQLQVLHRSRPRRLRLAKADRWLWALLSRIWAGWRTALVIVKPETVIAWHRRGFRLWWAWESRRRLGRPTVPADVRSLIRTMRLLSTAACPRKSNIPTKPHKETYPRSICTIDIGVGN